MYCVITVHARYSYYHYSCINKIHRCPLCLTLKSNPKSIKTLSTYTSNVVFSAHSSLKLKQFLLSDANFQDWNWNGKGSIPILNLGWLQQDRKGWDLEIKKQNGMGSIPFSTMHTSGGSSDSHHILIRWKWCWRKLVTWSWRRRVMFNDVGKAHIFFGDRELHRIFILFHPETRRI